MTRFLLALLAVAASATLASAQTPVFEVRDASGATLHFAVNDDGTVTCTDCISGDEIADGSVTGDDLADGTVAPVDINGGLFNGLTRNQLYERLAGGAVVGGDGLIATAVVACDTAEDIPITGSCFANDIVDADLQRFGPLSWEETEVPAAYSCVYKNRSEVGITIQARITCLDVTPDTPTLAPDLAPSPER